MVKEKDNYTLKKYLSIFMRLGIYEKMAETKIRIAMINKVEKDRFDEEKFLKPA